MNPGKISVGWEIFPGVSSSPLQKLWLLDLGGATGKRQMGPFLDLGPPALGLAVDRVRSRIIL